MKILAEMMIVAVAIFLLLAVISSILMITFERREVAWGLKEEASALVISLSEFLEGEDFRLLTAGLLDSETVSTFRKPLRRVANLAQVRSVDLFGLSPGFLQPVLSFGDPLNPEELELSSEERENILQGRTFVRSKLRRGDPDPRMIAYGPITTSQGEITGLLVVSTSAAALADYAGSVRPYIIWISLLLVSLGVVASIVTSRIITREIARLDRAAAAFADGQHDIQLQGGIIEEVRILSETFRTMRSVIQGAAEKVRRELVQGEQFCSEEDLAMAYMDLGAPPEELSAGGCQVIWRSIGGKNGGDFWTALDVRGGGRAVLGRVLEESELERSIAATAAASFIRQELSGSAPARVLVEVSKIFRLENCVIISWERGEQDWHCWCYRESGIEADQGLAFGSGDLVVATTMPPETEKGIQAYLKSFPLQSARELSEDLGVLLKDETSGSILIVQFVSGPGGPNESKEI